MGGVQSVFLRLFRPLDFLLDVVQSRSWKVDNAKNTFLLKNYGPVEKELFEKNLNVVGNIPAELVGEFVRNGPNPQKIPRGGYHWFDGDGMLHGVRINPDGTVNYVNRITETNRLKLERSVGSSLIPRIGEMKGKSGLSKLMAYALKTSLRLINLDNGVGSANTAVQFHDGKLLALVENDHPYAIRVLQDGQFETIGRYSYGGKLKHTFTAHPKIDAETNELIFFGYQLHAKPYCTYSVASADGELLFSTDLGLKQAVMMHDFAITKQYSLFLDFPLEFHPKEMCSAPAYSAFRFVDRPCRIGVVPRHCANAEEEARWFEFQPGYVFHTMNAWVDEDSQEIVLYACRSNRVQLDTFSRQWELARGEGEEGGVNDKVFEEDTTPYPHVYRMNLKTGETTEHPLATEESGRRMGCEFPTINPLLCGRKNRYVYLAYMDMDCKDPAFKGAIKIDLEQDGKVVGKIDFGEGKHGGECVFVPRNNSLDNFKLEDEDDGFLLTFVYDSNKDSSEFWVMDGRSMDSQPLAVVPLPQRVPYGFHGIWVSQEQIDQQKPF